MPLSRSLRSATAVCLLSLFGVLGTGLPSHHHERPPVAEGPQLLAADHHSHGTQLVEQAERAPSSGPHVTATPAFPVILALPIDAPVEAYEAELLRPTDRAPPPGAPRAPPHSA